MTTCEPGRFCPDHPLEPGLLVLLAAALIGITLFATAAALLVVTLATAARYIGRRIARARRPRTPPPTAPAAPARQPETAPAAHLAVIAAALDDWWTTADPAVTFDGDTIAPHVEMYLLSSGYHITPNP